MKSEIKIFLKTQRRQTAACFAAVSEVGLETLAQYMEWMQDAYFFFFPVPAYNASFSECDANHPVAILFIV
ncbi:hypothetical protein Aksp01_16980 [Akkermansia sp. NBRC 115031]|nr:hypothetical protein Aksp01_16980 [Akkermansia sp. NBRC 115031]